MNRTVQLLALPGDGIGPDVVDVAVEVAEAAASRCGFTLAWLWGQAGAGHYRDTGESISPASLQAVREVDAVLLGAMGLPDVRTPQGTEVNPQIELREHYDLFASLRPVNAFGRLSVLRTGSLDALVIRELSEGLFAGRREPWGDADTRHNRMTISRSASERLFRVAFEYARTRKAGGTRGRVSLFDKANVLDCFVLFRRVFQEVATEYPDIEAECLYVDAGAMRMLLEPERFDVVVTENQFGDIVSEIAAGAVGGIGLAPSADLGTDVGVFQPSHGSAPDLAGRGIANPVATVLSVAMALRWLASRHSSAQLGLGADVIEGAVRSVVTQGPWTPDLGGTASTVAVGEALTRAVLDQALAPSS